MAKVPQGVMVPLVTPFFEDESIDFESYKKIIDYTIDGGMHGILVGGSTGEYHMMSLEERKELIKKGCEFAAGRVPVMAGTGEYTAKDTIELTNFAADCGATWALVLPPFYQHTTEEGIYEFFKEIAENSKISFQYFQWNIKKETELRKDGQYYEISPWALAGYDENYYMIGYDSEEKKIKHYTLELFQLIKLKQKILS